MSGVDHMNVVLIVLDSLRADHLGCYGYSKPTSPLIDSLAERGVLFENCYAGNIPTHPSFTTMLTGTEAITHNIVNISNKAAVAEDVPFLAELLQQKGYITAAVDNMGRHFPRGMDIYEYYEFNPVKPTMLRMAEEVNSKALPLIEKLTKQAKPFFLMIHYWDPHTPYLPPPPFNTMFYPKDRDPYDIHNHSMDRVWAFEPFAWYFHSWMPGVTDSEYPIALYDGEIAYMDHHLRAVLKELESVMNDTVVIITADHGEILMEQEGYFDHHGLYEGNIHIPLIFYGKSIPERQRVPGFVMNIDLSPTIMDLMGATNQRGIEDRSKLLLSRFKTLQMQANKKSALRETKHFLLQSASLLLKGDENVKWLGMEGKSLLPCLVGLSNGNYEEMYFSEATWELKRAIRTGKWKLINSIEQDLHRRPMQELYDLEVDPCEQNNVIDQYPEVTLELATKLQAWVAGRLQETNRTIDPVKEQGVCATRVGTPVPGEQLGAGATPLHKRHHQKAAGIPAPDSLNIP
jgi:arylsulfatase A-like enzyme